MNSRTLSVLVVLLSLSALAVSATLAIFGKWPDLFGRQLSAEIQLSEVELPAAFRIDPVLISNEISSRMTQRTETDTALRIMLNAGQNELLRNRAIPRLVNAGVIRRMLGDMEGLGTVIDFSTYKSYARVTIENRSPRALNDVALVLPYARRAERLDQEELVFRLLDGSIGAISIPTLQPKETAEINVWLDTPSSNIVEQESRILLGAAESIRGGVRLYGATSNWNGADLEVFVWARWLVALFCVSIAFGAMAGVVLVLVAGIRRRSASGSPYPSDTS